MASKDFDSDELFTAPEIERANRLPARSMELLKRHGIGPRASVSAIRGKADQYEFAAFCFFAAAAALHHSGMSIVASARVAAPLTEELVSAYGEIPWGADRWRELPNDDLDGVFNPDGKVVALKMLRKFISNGVITDQRSFPGDYKLIIADGVRVYSRGHEDINIYNPHSTRITSLCPEFYILPLTRGEDVTIEELEPKDHDDFIDAIEFAVALVQVNFSLAVRRALYEVHYMRRRVSEKRGEVSGDGK